MLSCGIVRVEDAVVRLFGNAHTPAIRRYFDEMLDAMRGWMLFGPVYHGRTASSGIRWAGSEFGGIEPDRQWAVIDDGHVHFRTEPAGLYTQSVPS